MKFPFNILGFVLNLDLPPKKSSNIKLGIVNLAYLHTEQYCSFIARFSDKSYSKFSISYSNHLIKTLKIHLKYVNICTPLVKTNEQEAFSFKTWLKWVEASYL